MSGKFSRVLVAAALAGLVATAVWRFWPQLDRLWHGSHLTRPYGMAPAAFSGYVRACQAARISPFRIAQTIGDAPMSVGYHKRDGVLRYHGQKIDYTTALDLETVDLSRHQINLLLEAMAKQGFVAFYREQGKWRFNKHIHAVYALLPMKSQLKLQVVEWLNARRLAHDPIYKWEKHWTLKQ